MTVKVAAPASGSGSNLQALLDADLGPAEVALVVVNVAGAKALERARAKGVAAELVDHKAYGSREAFDAAVVERLRAHGIEWVVLAGFMRLVTEVFLGAFEHRVVNIHPSLLPSFPGVRAQAQALAAGVKVTGCTVHLVDGGMDTGPVLAQVAVPVLPGDDEPRLSQRILQQEHRVLPRVVRALAEGRLVQDGPRHFHLDLPATPTALSSPSGLAS